MEEELKNIDKAIDATHFLKSILEKSTVLSSRIDDQLNILLGLSTAVFIFSASKVDPVTNYWWAVLAFFSGLSIIIGLFAVHPPRFITKVGQDESLMYNKNIAKRFKNSKEYTKKLLEVVNNHDAIVHQYATEVYNVYKYYYGPKRKLFKFSRLILAVGIVLTFLLFMVSRV